MRSKLSIAKTVRCFENYDVLKIMISPKTRMDEALQTFFGQEKRGSFF